jgi:hypothetical protein
VTERHVTLAGLKVVFDDSVPEGEVRVSRESIAKLEHLGMISVTTIIWDDEDQALLEEATYDPLEVKSTKRNIPIDLDQYQ